MRELVVHQHKRNDPDATAYHWYMCGRRARSDQEEMDREAAAEYDGVKWRYCLACEAASARWRTKHPAPPFDIRVYLRGFREKNTADAMSVNRNEEER